MNEATMKKTEKGFDVIMHSIWDLDNLAGALELCGNTGLAAKLDIIKNKLKAALQLLREADKEAFDLMYNQAQGSSGNVLRAALAGIELSKGDKQ